VPANGTEWRRIEINGTDSLRLRAERALCSLFGLFGLFATLLGRLFCAWDACS